jgi:hypothetical protein
MESFMTDYADYIAVAVGFVIFFDRLAKITPTESDNKIVAYAYKLFAILGLKVKDNTGK